MAVNVFNGRGDVKCPIKDGKDKLRWDKTSCGRFDANQVCVLMGVVAYNLLHILGPFSPGGEEEEPSIEPINKALMEVGARLPDERRRGCTLGVDVSFGSTLPRCVRVRAD